MSKDCACGKPLHYATPERQAQIEQIVSELGETIEVTVPSGRFRVPRHYIALHGLVASELPQLAAILGFEKIE